MFRHFWGFVSFALTVLSALPEASGRRPESRAARQGLLTTR
jgi:hypothetical protein